MFESMVEKVARAIARARFRREYGEDLNEGDVDALAARCFDEARAAIEAVYAHIDWVRGKDEALK